ncbi:type II toxin-antitoxin system PemK/MazF family toxin [Natronosporangium hydrolyticum]|uniref:mRNA interferase n=1 Tax=Natronosporangium hydrolyticum TaxID=2811111 RepID=A0A895Y7T5_9ACTN|nr:type II toxin-antitoxin system PemK/MazF family toxin [Natronosporangium hydrolyticum]QSB13777.1 type II toxin-antitoxin system PemK/MazF family toxin [Natronosporangium hydrolyticum]
MRRGEVYLVDLEPAQGAEANKVRPAVVVSNDAANRSAEQTGRGVVTVVPVTSNTGRVYPFQVLLRAADSGLREDSKAQAEQVRSVAVRRIRQRVGGLPAPVLAELDRALRLHLAL